MFAFYFYFIFQSLASDVKFVDETYVFGEVFVVVASDRYIVLQLVEVMIFGCVDVDDLLFV